MSRIEINKDDPLKLKKVTLALEGILMIWSINKANFSSTDFTYLHS